VLGRAWVLLKMATLPNLINADLVRGFTVAQVAEKHGWLEPLVWFLALEAKTDHDRFKALGWGFRTWDQWEFNDCDNRFGDDWPGRIPAQLIAHILRYFSQPGDLVLFDPPYFDKKAGDYDEKSISGLSRNEYLDFLAAFFALLKQHVKKKTRLAFINADWRDFQNTPAMDETHKGGILIDDYLEILNKTGWYHTHIIQAPMSSQRFSAGVVSAMQKKGILGVISRYVIVLGQNN
jgi:hypothetical protein